MFAFSAIASGRAESPAESSAPRSLAGPSADLDRNQPRPEHLAPWEGEPPPPAQPHLMATLLAAGEFAGCDGV